MGKILFSDLLFLTYSNCECKIGSPKDHVLMVCYISPSHPKIRRPKLRWSDVIRKHTRERQLKIEEVLTKPENMEIENLMRRPKIWKRLKEKTLISHNIII